MKEGWRARRDYALMTKDVEGFKRVWLEILPHPQNDTVYEIAMHKLRCTLKLDPDGSSRKWLVDRGYAPKVRRLRDRSGGSVLPEGRDPSSKPPDSGTVQG